MRYNRHSDFPAMCNEGVDNVFLRLADRQHTLKMLVLF